MEYLTDLTAFLLTSMGLTVLVVWPEHGPSAWLREHLLRRSLPRPAQGVLDCYICAGFWIGLLLSPVWWYLSRAHWAWFGCLMTPALFWLTLVPMAADTTADPRSHDAEAS